ncbi:MAG TPA: hypothetical protein VFI00_07660 [Kribbella sp.]|nr:hypothetical protein [Kribbella sp.]
MAPSEPDPVPDPEQARRTTTRLLWSCAVLTLLVGVFQLSGILRDADGYDALAWVGVAVAALSMLALIAIYCACALERLTLRTRVVDRIDLFQVTTVLLLLAIIAGIPTSSTGALALLLPFGLTYWLHNLNVAKPDGPTSSAP